jgi:aryl-alcohol dehydrogenase-like predicted oxidoreductase
MKLVLGSANFGTSYGLLNTKKKVSSFEIKKILKICKKNKIRFIDTAINYKSSETLIGKFSKSKDFRVITKLPKIGKNFNLINNYISQSLKKLKRKKIYGVLVHSLDDLNSLNLEKILFELNKLKKKKLIRKIGVSVYKKKNLEKIIKKYRIDIVQLPLSIFDQRFVKQNFLYKLKKKKIEIFVRSIFLQGVIFQNIDKIKFFFKNYSSKIIKFKKDFGNDKNQMIRYCLSFIKSFKYIDGIVFGVDGSKNLNQILSNNVNIKIKNLNKYSISSEKILIPYNWKKIK